MPPFSSVGQIGTVNIPRDSLADDEMNSAGSMEKGKSDDDAGEEKIGPQRIELQGQIGYIHDEYLARYKEDASGSEASPNARVWRMFMDETQAYDLATVTELRENTDILLVFAGLFSAVVTTFVVRSADQLQPDYAEITATLLFEMAALQRASANGSSIDDIPMSSLTPSAAHSSSLAAWTNGLWFTSLSLSLLAALVAVLARQWLQRFIQLPRGTAQDRSRIRHLRYTGFMQWRVPAIIGLLPLILHAALGLFLLGLVVLLVEIQPPSALAVGVLSSSTFAAYVIAAVLPLVYDGCPYRTPLTGVLLSLWTKSIPLFSRLFGLGFSRSRNYGKPPPSASKKVRATKDHDVDLFHELDAAAVEKQKDVLDCYALSWLYRKSPNLGVHAIILQSIGGLPVTVESKFLKAAFAPTSITDDFRDILQECLLKPRNETRGLAIVPGQESTVRRLLQFEHRYFGWKPQPDSLRQASQDLIIVSPPGPPTTLSTSLLFSKGRGKRASDTPRDARDLVHRLFRTSPDPGQLVLHPWYWERLIDAAINDGLFLETASTARQSADWAYVVRQLFRWLGYNKEAFWSTGPPNYNTIVSGFDVSEGLNAAPVRTRLIDGLLKALPSDSLKLPDKPPQLNVILVLLNTLIAWMPQQTADLHLMDQQPGNPFSEKLLEPTKEKIKQFNYVECISSLLEFLNYTVSEQKVDAKQMKQIFNFCRAKLFEVTFVAESRDIADLSDPVPEPRILNAYTCNRGPFLKLLSAFGTFSLDEEAWYRILNTMYDPIFMMGYKPDGKDEASSIITSYNHLNNLLNKDLRVLGNISTFRAWRRANMLNRLGKVEMRYHHICGWLIPCYISSVWQHIDDCRKGSRTPAKQALADELRLHVEDIHRDSNLFTVVVGHMQEGPREELSRLVSLEPHAPTWAHAVDQLNHLSHDVEYLKSMLYVRMPPYDLHPYILPVVLPWYQKGSAVLKDLLAQERSKPPPSLSSESPESIQEDKETEIPDNSESKKGPKRKLRLGTLLEKEKTRANDDNV